MLTTKTNKTTKKQTHNTTDNNNNKIKNNNTMCRKHCRAACFALALITLVGPRLRHTEHVVCVLCLFCAWAHGSLHLAFVTGATCAMFFLSHVGGAAEGNFVENIYI
jgi:hypothetical protein